VVEVVVVVAGTVVVVDVVVGPVLFAWPFVVVVVVGGVGAGGFTAKSVPVTTVTWALPPMGWGRAP
jgi:hypothetical protein